MEDTDIKKTDEQTLEANDKVKEENNIEKTAAATAEKPVEAPVDETMSMEDLLKAEEAVSEKIYSRDIVNLRVVQVNQDTVFVDVNEKKEAIIPLSEFTDEKTPQIGDEVQAVLEKKGSEGHPTVMSHRRAKERIALVAVKAQFEAKERVKGRISEIIKGGYLVDLSGLRAFMPLSLSEIGGAHKHYLPVGARIKVYITDFNEKDRKVVVSRRQALEEDEKVRRTKTLEEVQAGNVVRGVVSKVTDDGVFVRFQGIEGLVKKEDVAWKDFEEAMKKYKRSQRVRCRILTVDKENETLTFGFKQLQQNPVGVLKRKFIYRSRVKAVITAVNETGCEAKINNSTDAFISAEDYGSEGAPEVGKEISAVVVGINAAEFKVLLSVRRSEEQEDRKRMQQYLKGSPHFTIGQVLMEDTDESKK